MSKVSRPAKARGYTTYHEEVGAGKPDILDVEVDNDFDTIYKWANGQISDINIAAGAAIDYSKLNLRGRIVYTDLATGFILPGNQVGPGIPAGSIPDSSITWQKIAPFNSLVTPPAAQSGAGPSGVAIPCTNIALQHATVTVSAPRTGGLTYLMASVHIVYPTTLVGSTVNALFTAKVWSGGIGNRLVAQSQHQGFGYGGPGLGVEPVTLHLLGNDLLAAGVTAYDLTIDSVGSGTAFNVQWSSMIIIEPA